MLLIKDDSLWILEIFYDVIKVTVVFIKYYTYGSSCSFINEPVTLITFFHLRMKFKF